MARRAVKRAPSKRIAGAPPTDALTDKQQAFVREYLVDLAPTKAAVRAGYSPASATDTAYDLLRTPRVAAAIEQAMAARAQRTEIEADDVLRRWWALATADVNELVEYRRGCCRWCYGIGHRYQWTQGELDKHREDQTHTEGDAKWKRDERGGVGYDPRRAPNPRCPECFGDGVGEVIVKDTRSLSPAARLLYAGVKQTKEGLEVKMRSQDEALVNVAKHLGMFVEKREHSGPGGGPIVLTAATPEERAAAVAALLARAQQRRLGTGTDGQ